jgi:formate/nitrite transporter FocA (FNT family)
MAALVADGIDVWSGLVALGCATIGNAVGGVLFVALLKYSLIVRSRYSPSRGIK